MILLNWKANGTKELVKEFNEIFFARQNIVLFPPIHLIHNVDTKMYEIGAQNVSQCSNGAFTGEITAKMLFESGVKYCLVGHSERRQYFGENNDIITKKIAELIKFNIIPVVCVGETLDERKAGKCFDILRNQLSICNNNCIIAYEPIWAIGTGVVPTNNEIDEVIHWVKNQFHNTKVLYGGSVSSKNIEDISKTSADGILVGGASLKIEEVLQFIKYF